MYNRETFYVLDLNYMKNTSFSCKQHYELHVPKVHAHYASLLSNCDDCSRFDLINIDISTEQEAVAEFYYSADVEGSLDAEQAAAALLITRFTIIAIILGIRRSLCQTFKDPFLLRLGLF